MFFSYRCISLYLDLSLNEWKLTLQVLELCCTLVSFLNILKHRDLFMKELQALFWRGLAMS